LINTAQLREPLPPNSRAADLVLRDLLHLRNYTRATTEDLRNLLGRINSRYPGVLRTLRSLRPR
jgi:hypothetical protein